MSQWKTVALASQGGRGQVEDRDNPCEERLLRTVADCTVGVHDLLEALTACEDLLVLLQGEVPLQMGAYRI